jgi:dephospho-CoA kinase
MTTQSPSQTHIDSGFSPDQPVFIGLCGPAGSGKTSTANRLIPPVTENTLGEYPTNVWYHTWFAFPLYMMASAKRDIQGMDEKNRKLYAIHEVVNDLVMKRCSFDDMIELIYDIYAMPLDNTDKPRSFLQNAGDLCRQRYEDCFADYVKYRILSNYRNIAKDYIAEDYDPPKYYALISDVRMPNEAKMIKQQENGILIKLTATPEILKERLYERDGVLLNPSQAEHNSENSFSQIPEDWFDAIIDTTNKTLNEVAFEVLCTLRDGQRRIFEG